MTEKSLYIAILEFGVSKIDTGFKNSDLLIYLKQNGLEVNIEDPVQLLRFFMFLNDNFFEGHDNRRYSSVGETKNYTYFIRSEAYFNYLDYIELQEALKSSREAKSISIGAIVISALFAVASICFQIAQMDRPVEIESSQIKDLKETTVQLDQGQFDTFLETIDNEKEENPVSYQDLKENLK